MKALPFCEGNKHINKNHSPSGSARGTRSVPGGPRTRRLWSNLSAGDSGSGSDPRTGGLGESSLSRRGRI